MCGCVDVWCYYYLRPKYLLSTAYTGFKWIKNKFYWMKSLDKFQSKDLETLALVREQIKQMEQTEDAAADGGQANAVLNWYQVDEEKNPNALNNAISGFLTHVILKAVVFVLFLFRGMFSTLFNGLVLNEMIVVFAVLDFWTTKNFNGKRLLGIRWYFDVDEHGTEKFFFECRANDEYLSFTWAKLFWIVQLGYTISPFLFMMLGFIRALYVLINLELILVSIGILFVGGINLFFFFQASSAASLKQKQIKRRLTPQEMDEIGFATIISFT